MSETKSLKLKQKTKAKLTNDEKQPTIMGRQNSHQSSKSKRKSTGLKLHETKEQNLKKLNAATAGAGIRSTCLTSGDKSKRQQSEFLFSSDNLKQDDC